MNSNRHEILEMLYRGAITVDDAVWQLEQADPRRCAPLRGISPEVLSGKGFM